MTDDIDEIFAEYEKLVADVDTLFEKVKSTHPKEVKCAVGCCDCCYALFDLSLVEAMYVKRKLGERFPGHQELEELMGRANAADRQTYKFKRELAKKRQEGVPEDELLRMAGEKRIRCALLNADYRCDLYEHRPITCRLYGIPLAIAGQGQTCGQSGFKPGGRYPTVHLEKIQDRLFQLSQAIVEKTGSPEPELGEIVVPLSMALLTEYDREYFQTDEQKEKQPEPGSGQAEWVLGGRGE